MNGNTHLLFTLYYFTFCVRETLSYLSRTPNLDLAPYQERRKFLENVLADGSYLDKFFNDNVEAESKSHSRDKLQNFVDEVYSDNSIILRVEGDHIHVDEAQTTHLFELVVQTGEVIRDVLYGHIRAYKQRNLLEDDRIERLVDADERAYRIIVDIVGLTLYQKGNSEVQQILRDHNGQATPDTNYIVINVLNKIEDTMRFSNSRARFTDNRSLDLLEDVTKFIEMVKGRRDRPNNANLDDIHKELAQRIDEQAGITQNKWMQLFNEMYKDCQEFEKERAGQALPKEDVSA
ncbi:MAG: hypothetical protein LUD22_04105 [Coprobacillus sp.]|nr:hypothetical protein [Coprobacillus sp.]